MIRWSYVAPRLFAVLLVVAFLVWGIGPLIRWSLIRTGQAVTGARIDIRELAASFWKGELKARDVEIADPNQLDRNWFEFREGAIQFSVHALAKKRIDIEYARLRGFEWRGPRTESGALTTADAESQGWRLQLAAQQNRWLESGQEWLEQYAKWAGQAALRQLETVQLMEQFEGKWQQRAVEWKRHVETFEQRVQRIRRLVEAAREDPRAHVAEIQQVMSDSFAMRDELVRMRKEFEQLGDELRRDYQSLDQAKQTDLRKLEHALQLAEFDSRQLSESLLGRQLANRIETLLDWCEVVSKAMDSAGEAPQAIRARGEDVAVWSVQRRPAFTARVLDVDGFASVRNKRIPFRARLRNVSSEPEITGPVVADVRMLTDFPAMLRVKTDFAGPTPRHDIIFSQPQVPVPSIVWGDDRHLALNVKQGESQLWCRLQIEGTQVQGLLLLRQDKLSVRPQLSPRFAERHGEAAARRLTAMMERVTDPLDRVQVRIDLAGTLGEPKWTFQTDLGAQLKLGFEQALAFEAEWLKQQAARQLDDRLALHRQRLEQQYDEQRSSFLADLETWNSQLQRWGQWKMDPRQLLDHRTAERLKELPLQELPRKLPF